MDVTACTVVWKIDDDGNFMRDAVLVFFNEDQN
jgi:hypothetical protein